MNVRQRMPSKLPFAPQLASIVCNTPALSGPSGHHAAALHQGEPTVSFSGATMTTRPSPQSSAASAGPTAATRVSDHLAAVMAVCCRPAVMAVPTPVASVGAPAAWRAACNVRQVRYHS